MLGSVADIRWTASSYSWALILNVWLLLNTGNDATFLEGSLVSSETWSFLARFCFLSHNGQLRYTITFPVLYQPYTLLMYFDDPDQWPAVYKKGMTCTQMTSPPHILPENNQAITMDLSEFWSGCQDNQDGTMTCKATRNFESSKQRWWYLALSRCQNTTLPGINVKYQVLMTNGEPSNLWTYQFSADEFYILQVDIAVLCALLLLLFLAFVAAYQLKKRFLLHTSYKIYLLSLSMEVFYLFIMCIAYGQFANNGINNDGLKTFGRVADAISVLVFILMLLLMGKGYTITRGRISTGGSIKLAIFMTLFAITYAVLFFYQALFFDPGVVLYIYESPPGYGILVLRLIAWIYFSYACFFTLKHYPEKSKFYYPFYIFYSVWFLIGPIFVIIAYVAWPKYARATIVNGVDCLITLLAQSFLLFLTRPSNSNKNFPFHVRTSQIGILRDKYDEHEDFPSYPYAPSANWSEPNSGPNFTAMFNVAREMYSQDPVTLQTIPALPSAVGRLPPITKQTQNGKVPIDRFPHENGDPMAEQPRTKQFNRHNDEPPSYSDNFSVSKSANRSSAKPEDFNAAGRNDPFVTQKNESNADPFVTTSKGQSRGRQSIAAHGDEGVRDRDEPKRAPRRSIAVPPKVQGSDDWE